MAIHQDNDGFMWFATWGGGAVRYDGQGFETFTTDNGLASNQVMDIYQDTDGHIWFATADGVSRYDGHEWVTFTEADGLGHNLVHSIFQDKQGRLWFGTDSGVSYYDGNRFVTLTTADGLPSNDVYSVYQDAGGLMWFGALGGLSHYDGQSVVPLGGPGIVHAIHQDREGTLWFGTWGRGVFRYDGQRLVQFSTDEGFPHPIVRTICETSDGNLWFGTGFESVGGGGVCRYDGENFVTFTTADGLVKNVVTNVYQDTAGRMWFATEGGISQYDPASTATLTVADGLVHHSVNAVHRNDDGRLWFGTDSGVSCYEGQDIITFTEEDGLIGNHVTAIYRDTSVATNENSSIPAGMLWFVTREGVAYYDGTKMNPTIRKGNLGISVPLRAVQRDADGALWVATGNDAAFGQGVFRYDGKRTVNLQETDGLAGNDVADIYQSADGAMWFATHKGISRYKGATFDNFIDDAEGFAHNWINCIYGAPDGRLWFGRGSGVSVLPSYDNRRFVTYKHVQQVRSIYQAGNGHMWVGTKSSAYQYDGVAWALLDTRDGLAGNEIRSIEGGEGDSLWFGTDGGATRYLPTRIRPKVRIVSVKTSRVHTDFKQLPPVVVGDRVTIRYSAIDFKTVAGKRQYRYRIEERDTNWRQPTKSDMFDNVFEKPGTFTFSVQAIDRDLNNSEPASVTLTVVLPWYQNGWILYPSGGGILALALFAGIYAYHYYQERRRVIAYQRLAVEEVQDARRVQMGLMPEVAPEIEGLEIAGKCLSANTVSGDFFDYLSGERSDEIAIVVGDVTGHGMQGAMNATLTDGVLQMAAEKADDLSPSALMTDVNNVLKPRMESGMNVTMVIGLINAKTKTLFLANAGHHAHPLILHDEAVRPLISKGMPLGMITGITYREVEFPLQSGDVLVFMTDGIIEVQDSDGTYYADSGLLEAAMAQFAASLSAEGMVDVILNDAMAFGGDSAQRDDDMTVVVVKVL